ADRVWQTNFSEFETTAGGIWRICAVIDDATKYCLAVTMGPTSRAQDAVACLHAAIAEAERVSRSTWLPSPRNQAQSPRNRLAVGSLTTGVPQGPRKKSGRRCRIGAEVFVAGVSGRPRGRPKHRR